MERGPFIKNRYDTDFTPTFKSVYLLMVDKFGINSRVSNFMEMFRVSFDIQEWISYDPRLVQNMNFESYLMDQLKKFIEGDGVDFNEIYNAILTVGDFTGSEIYQFESGNVEEVIWAIFMACIDPMNKNKIRL